MPSMMREQLFRRVLAETGRPAYFGGSGIGLLPGLHRATGPWSAAVCIDEPASPIAAWLKVNTDAELFCFPKLAGTRGRPPAPTLHGPWDAGTVPAVLGDSERDLVGVEDIAFGFAAKPVRFRQRSLDGLLGDALRPGFIHIGSLHQAAAIIRGAQRLLHRCHPAILLVRDAPAGRGSGVTEFSALAEAFSDARYQLYDGMLNPCGTAEEIRTALDRWLESAFLGLPKGYDIATLMHAFWDDLTSYRPSPERGLRLAVHEITDCTGFYAEEHWDDLRWRWTGPRPRASVRVPLARPGYYRLCCRLLKVANDQILDSLRIFVNGEAIRHMARISEHQIVLEADLSLSLARFAPVTEILFVHSETYSINPDDPRRLGLALMAIELERQG